MEAGRRPCVVRRYDCLQQPNLVIQMHKVCLGGVLTALVFFTERLRAVEEKHCESAGAAQIRTGRRIFPDLNLSVVEKADHDDSARNIAERGREKPGAIASNDRFPLTTAARISPLLRQDISRFAAAVRRIAYRPRGFRRSASS